MIRTFASAPALLAVGLLLSGCAQLGLTPRDTPAQTAPVAAPDPTLTAAPPPPMAANTAESLDTTSAAQRAEAAAPAAPEMQARALGTTVVSLGSPTEPGFWLKTPLVSAETQGRVTNPGTGKSAAVRLIPIDGPPTAGSRLSLPAMRLIGASLTDLTEVTIAGEG